MSEHTTLVKLDHARKLLDEARTCDEIKKIHSHAEALRAYSQQQKLSVDCYNRATEIKLRAERRMGESLSAMAKNKGGQHTHRNSTGKEAPTSAPTLRELEITKQQSVRYQQLSQVSEQQFNHIVAQANAASERLTTQRVLRELDSGTSSKRHKSAANTTSPEGTVIVPVTVLLKKDCRTPFLKAWEFLGDGASEVTFKAVMRAAKRRPKGETNRTNGRKSHGDLVA